MVLEVQELIARLTFEQFHAEVPNNEQPRMMAG
jgi:hypothetical protein